MLSLRMADYSGVTIKKMAGNFVQTGRKIVAIGRNFAAHAAELKNAGKSASWRSASTIDLRLAVPKEPFFFLKRMMLSKASTTLTEAQLPRLTCRLVGPLSFQEASSAIMKSNWASSSVKQHAT